jgi:Fe-S cluster assembly protein SufD
VAPIARTAFQTPPAVCANTNALAPFARGVRLAFSNGRLTVRPSSLPQGVQLGPLAADASRHLGKYASFENHAFVALNTAFLGETAYVRIAPGTIVEQPIHLIYVSSAGPEASVTHPRALLVVGANAQCTIVETYAGTGAYFTNAVTEIVVGEGSAVDHYKVQTESPEAFHIASLHAQIGPLANYSTHSISLGGALVRSETTAVLSAGSEATLNGLYLLNGVQHVENRVTVDHAEPGASSRQLYKGILDGKSTAAFNGRILVRKHAQKTDAKQTNKNLLLSRGATINTKPELQIYADDVRCTHGATIGQLDADAMFYLRSRGLGTNEARGLLTYAFPQDAISQIRIQSLKDSLERTLFEKFHDHAQ